MVYHTTQNKTHIIQNSALKNMIHFHRWALWYVDYITEDPSLTTTTVAGYVGVNHSHYGDLDYKFFFFLIGKKSSVCSGTQIHYRCLCYSTIVQHESPQP